MSAKLPDGGAQLRAQREAILRRIAELKRPVPTLTGALPGGSQPASVRRPLCLCLHVYFSASVFLMNNTKRVFLATSYLIQDVNVY